eukprot:CAMPEP_0184679794 /NCGR_PEP_ID=MMETSP0312-20130426/2663_1 /TAXON_ID=31354 /ORGANISM="Compsopogon coeruleus, Strain SAG 36.94" /LENGTH=103 /DNA_ID=CAMNT_0027129483 /DNA_START=57 /DNA_END=368 /DNA_ORIENTATION=-
MTHGQVKHRPDLEKFTLTVEGQEAFLCYRKQGTVLDLWHTYTPENARGQGVAQLLADAAFKLACEQSWKIVPSCSYISDRYLPTHPEYHDLVVNHHESTTPTP